MELIEREITLGAQRISYYQEGPRDRSVLLIHGNSSTKAAFREQCTKLVQAGYGILAFDLPGHGSSSNAPNPAEGYNIPAYAKIAAQLCEATGVERPLLCGWSLGGHVAIQMAGNDASYSGLMIFGTPPIGLNLEDAAMAFLNSDFSDVTGMESPSEEQLLGYISAIYGSSGNVEADLIDAGFRTDGRSRAFMVQYWQNGSDLHDQRDIVENWQGPLLIVHGVDDPFVSGQYFKSLNLKTDVKNQTIEMLENFGHAPFMEAPIEFNRLLLDFCDTCFET